jgi:hypothetical protein
MNLVLKPSGPDDLSFGICFTMESISSWVKGAVNTSRPCLDSRKRIRLKCIRVYLVVPNLSLKASHSNAALSPTLNFSYPSPSFSRLKPYILRYQDLCWRCFYIFKWGLLFKDNKCMDTIFVKGLPQQFSCT